MIEERIEKKKINNKPKVLCAMSGGVDSSVAAALLKKDGYDVIGVFMKLWAENTPRTDLVRENICCSMEAATAARAVCQKLKIPFYVLNLEKEFKKAVVDYYIKEYEEGRTPNPCVICNRDIKSEILLQKALELKADFLATGHYARIARKIQSASWRTKSLPADATHQALQAGENRNSKIKEYELHQAIDKTKDQTYFLWTLTQKQLAKTLFPVGNFTKVEVREIARKFNLSTAKRRESQGICFIPDRNVAGFLLRHAQKLTKPGDILDIKGQKIGVHNGLVNYTIGQRERLGLGGPKAYYVVNLLSKENILVVGDEKDLYKKDLVVSGLNWINKITFGQKISKITAKIRYGHPAEECFLKILDQAKIAVTFKKPQRAITPGQSIVFYAKDRVLGGGIIN